jgi:hypothetical protein
MQLHRVVFCNSWAGVGDWLGIGTIASYLRTYKLFEEAKEFVHRLNLKNQIEWQKYFQSGEKPDDIPANPNKVYKNKGKSGFRDWVGTGNMVSYKREYRPFKKAKAFVHQL